MPKRYFSLVLIVVILHVPGRAPAFAQSKSDAEPSLAAEQIRRKVYARGTGESARVSVELVDGTKLKGYIREVAADHFVVMRTDAQRGRAVKIDYREARKLKAQGKRLSPSK